jgi:hypothetical protein
VSQNLTKGAIKQLVERFVLKKLNNEEERWPNNLPQDLLLVAAVEYYCLQLSEHLPESIAPEAVSKSPGLYIPALKFMLTQIETDHHIAIAKGEPAPALFTLFPQPSLKWRFVPIDIRVLSSFFPDIQRPNRPVDYAETAYQVFNFECIKIHR